MKPELFPLIVGGVITSFFVLIIVISAKVGQKAWLSVERLAGKLGLTMESKRVTLGLFYGFPKASGERRGKWVEIFCYTTGSGKTQKTWSAVSARPRSDGGLKFDLRRQGFATKIAEFFGTREIQVGDPAFDARWFIQTNRPDYLAAALLPEVRAKLDAVGTEISGSFKLENGRVIYAENGGFNEVRCNRFEAITEIVCDLADIAEVAAESAR